MIRWDRAREWLAGELHERQARRRLGRPDEEG
jgi:hypothetical protein